MLPPDGSVADPIFEDDERGPGVGGANDPNDEEHESEPKNVRWVEKDQPAEALIAHLGHRFPAAFVSTGEIIGMPVVKNNTMDTETTAAMWEDAGVGLKGQRVIGKYQLVHLGFKTSASEHKVRKLGLTAIPPTTGETTIAKEHIVFSYKNVEQILLSKITEVVKENPTLFFDNLDFVMGGDHGGGTFKLLVKVLFKRVHEIMYECTMNVGEVECKHDTYDVLKATIMPIINDSLKRIIKYDCRNDGTIKNDGTLNTISHLDDANEKFAFNHEVMEGEELLQTRTFKFIITGDLAFYSIVLGMEGASSSACWLCLLKKSEWNLDPHQNGKERSMEWIKNTCSSCTVDNPINGLKFPPLLDAIDTCRYIVPPLHSMLGITNAILNDFKEFNDTLLEQAPEELTTIRHEETISALAAKKKMKELREYNALNGPILAECHVAKKDILEFVQYMKDSGEMTPEDAADAKEELQKLAEEIRKLNKGRIELTKEKTTLSSAWAKKSKIRAAWLRKNKHMMKYERAVKARVETVLRKHGIDPAAFHGGDMMVGNSCRKLTQKAEKVMADVEVVLMEVAAALAMSEETKLAIGRRCGAVRDALVVFDSIFSLMNKKNHEVNMAVDAESLDGLLKKGLVAWTNLRPTNKQGTRNITPKVHAMVSHLPAQFKMYHGIGDYDEQFVERSHQDGNRDQLKAKAMRCREVKYECYARWERIRTDPKVIRERLRVENERKRKRKMNDDGEPIETTKQRESRDRATYRRRIIMAIQPRDLDSESANILSLREKQRGGGALLP